jgi:hypothetical protein
VRALVRPLLTRPATDPQLEALLWVAVYQLQHSSLAAHAVVSNAVDAASLLRVTSAKGLVNAVLRYYLRNRATLDAQPPATEEARYPHAQWWIDLCARYRNAGATSCRRQFAPAVDAAGESAQMPARRGVRVFALAGIATGR